MKTERPKKKTETIEVRVSPETKQDFMAACRQKGETASTAIRKFVDAYIADANRAPAVITIKEMAMPAYATPARRRFSAAAGLAAVIGAGWSLIATPSIAADPRVEAVFKWMDADGNGRLTLHELENPREPGSVGNVFSFIEIRIGAVTAPEVAENYTVADFVVQNDINKDGAISLKEFSTVSTVVDSVIKFPLLDADANDDGQVTKSELSAFYNKNSGAAELDAYGRLMLDAVFAAHDSDGDGDLEPADFADTVTIE